MFRANTIFSQITKTHLAFGALACAASVAVYKFTPSFTLSTAMASSASTASSHAGLDASAFKAFELKDIAKYNHNSNVYVFKLEEGQDLQLPVASYVLTKASIEGKDVIRPYTPIDQGKKGELHLLVKVYPNSLMSKHFGEMKVGDKMEIKGPLMKCKYEANSHKEIGMIAGGTGLTPMLQIAEAILNNPEDKTQVTLLFANITPSDVLLKERLDELAAKHSNFKVQYVVEQTEGASLPSNMSIGRVNEDLVKQFMPKPAEDTRVFVCGPPGMLAAVAGPKGPNYTQGDVTGLLGQLGYTSQNVFKL